MNSRKTKEIEQLVQRFFDGETTTEEEARLYKVFRRKRLPDNLEPLRTMMMDFASMSEPKPKRATTISMVWRALTAAAAVLALIAGIAVYSDYHEQQALSHRYGGSYVIENGRRIDDLSAIRGDIEQALADSRHIEQRAEHNIIDRAEQNVLDNISDPVMRKEVELMLKK